MEKRTKYEKREGMHKCTNRKCSRWNQPKYYTREEMTGQCSECKKFTLEEVQRYE